MIQLLRCFLAHSLGRSGPARGVKPRSWFFAHQINVLRRKSPKKPVLSNVDRLLFVWLLVRP
jgi:hypothetical protein